MRLRKSNPTWNLWSMYAFSAGRSPDMHHCAFCKNPLWPLTEWKGNDGRFYCSEFCADAGDTSETSIISRPAEIVPEAGIQR
jgi:hypothetical protein